MLNNESCLPGFDTYFRNLLPAESDDCILAQQQQQKGKKVFLLCFCLFCHLLFFQSLSYFAQLLLVNKKRFLFIASQIMTLPPNLSNQCQTQISSRSNQLQLRPHSETHFLSLKRKNTFLTLLLFTSQSFQLM